MVCAFWDSEAMAYSQLGVSTDGGFGDGVRNVTCLTNHMTAFTLIPSANINAFSAASTTAADLEFPLAYTSVLKSNTGTTSNLNESVMKSSHSTVNIMSDEIFSSPAPTVLRPESNQPLAEETASASLPISTTFAPSTWAAVVAGLEMLGPLVLMLRMSLGVPPANSSSVYTLPVPYEKVSIVVPAGAWPVGSNRRNSGTPALIVAVFFLPSTLEGLPGTVCGPAVSLEPHNLQLLQPILVSIACDGAAPAGFVPVVYGFNSANDSWIPATVYNNGTDYNRNEPPGAVWAQTATLSPLAAFWVQQVTDEGGLNHSIIIAAVVGTVVCLAAAATIAAASARGWNCFQSPDPKSATETQLAPVGDEQVVGEVASASLVVADNTDQDHSTIGMRQSTQYNNSNLNSANRVCELPSKDRASGEVVFLSNVTDESTQARGDAGLFHSDVSPHVTEQQSMVHNGRMDSASLMWSSVEYLWGRKPVTELDSAQVASNPLKHDFGPCKQDQVSSLSCPMTIVTRSNSVPWQDQPAALLCPESISSFQADFAESDEALPPRAWGAPFDRSSDGDGSTPLPTATEGRGAGVGADDQLLQISGPSACNGIKLWHDDADSADQTHGVNRPGHVLGLQELEIRGESQISPLIPLSGIYYNGSEPMASPTLQYPGIQEQDEVSILPANEQHWRPLSAEVVVPETLFLLSQAIKDEEPLMQPVLMIQSAVLENGALPPLVPACDTSNVESAGRREFMIEGEAANCSLEHQVF
jgi:hypothetical protein